MSKYKVILVTRSDTTVLKVRSDFNLEKASDEDIRALLLNTIPQEGFDQVDNELELQDVQHIGPHKYTRHFNQEQL